MKKIASTTLVGLAAVVLTAANLSAQVCNGIAPFSAGKMRVGFGIRMPDGGNIFDGEFAMGAKSGLFGGANFSIFDPDFAGADNSTAFGGFIGKPMMVDAKKTVEMCPQGFVQFGENSSNSIGGMVSFGRNFKQTSFDLIPFGAASLHRDDPGGTADANFELDIDVGAGFVLNKKWTIRPSLNIPLTHTDIRDNMFGIAAYLNFGGTP
jgi:hypothetical protein